MIQIRAAKESDAPLLNEIGMRAWQHAMEAIGETHAMMSAARGAFEAFTAEGWRSITVLEIAGQMAGWAARQGLDGTISDFWIDPSFTRQGFGSALLQQIEKDIIARGYDRALLETHSGNLQAINFFQKHGYAIHALTVVYNAAIDRDVPTVSLSKTLSAQESDTAGETA